MRYDLVDLKLFLAIADSGNVSRGAALCNLAPSSASLRLKQLEETLGTKLFNREARGVSLTRAGQVMLDHARRCIATLEQMHADLAPYAQGVAGHIRLFANSSAITSFLPNDLRYFLLEHPKIRISLAEGVSYDIVAAVSNGRADIGVVTWEDEHPGLDFLPYREEELVVVSPKSFPIASMKSVSFAECLSYPFVCLQSGAAIHTFIMGKASSMGSRIDIRIQVSGYPALVVLVNSGAGIAILPKSVLQTISCANINVLQLREDWAERRLQLCIPQDKEKMTPYVKALSQYLTENRTSEINSGLSLHLEAT